jgi:hypothetical protein
MTWPNISNLNIRTPMLPCWRCVVALVVFVFLLKIKSPPLTTDNVLLFLQEEEVKYRSKLMGNVKFVGELYKLNILSTKIMHRYIIAPLLDVSLGQTDDSAAVREMDVSVVCVYDVQYCLLLTQYTTIVGETNQIVHVERQSD